MRCCIAFLVFLALPASTVAALAHDDCTSRGCGGDLIAFEWDEEDRDDEPAIDFCEEAGLYGDGACDEDCPKPDPDCIVHNCPPWLPYECPDRSCVAAEEGCRPSEEEVEIPVRGVQTLCPPALPYRCQDGECVADASDCTAVVDVPVTAEPVAPVQRETGEAAAQLVRTLIITERDVTTLQSQLLKDDVNLLTLQYDADVVTTSYRRSARLFGLKTVHYPLSLTIVRTQVEADYPWWLFFARHDAGDVVATLAATLEADDIVGGGFTEEFALIKRVMEILTAVFRSLPA